MKKYMLRAIELALKGKGNVHPNPMVGAVIVKDNTIIGEGYHEMFGGAHAEINALKQASEPVQGATMYVTLEPCSHYGKTPPCADAIIQAKLAKVVIASFDPNPLVAGNGIKRLKDAGIDVEVGLANELNQSINRIFFKYIQTKTPYVILKSAMTADGKIATHKHQSKWISNEASRRDVHETRAYVSAVMVGVGTVIKDDPLLTVRLEKEPTKQPIRIVLDPLGKIPLSAKLLNDLDTLKTYVVVGERVGRAQREALETKGAFVLISKADADRIDLMRLMGQLGALGIDSILLEGGSTISAAAFEAEIVDEYHLYIAPKIIGGAEALTPVGGIGKAHMDEAIMMKLDHIDQFDEDVRLIYRIKKEA